MTAPAAPNTPPRVLSAQWFDGRSSRARPVQIALQRSQGGARLLLRALDGERERLDLAPEEVGWPERWSARRAPPHLVVDLGAHGSLQVDDVAAWQAALAAADHRRPLAERMQTQWPMLLGVLLVAGAGIAAFYRWGTPWAATQLTRYVPLSWEQQISDTAMVQLDGYYLKPTKLSAERQAALRAGFDKLAAEIGPDLRRYKDYRPPLKLQFRSGMGANAFALPGGTIVLTDAMVEQAGKTPHTGDTALLGVLAHEIGHVEHRHGTRMVVQQGVLNVGLGLALGDVSTVVSTGAAALTGLAYQRSHEVESDCYAMALLKKAGLSAAPMADLLLSLEDDMRERIERAGTKADGAKGAASAASAPGKAASAAAAAPKPAASAPRERSADWFSTHPNTVTRAERLKSGAPLDCPR